MVRRVVSASGAQSPEGLRYLAAELGFAVIALDEARNTRDVCSSLPDVMAWSSNERIRVRDLAAVYLPNLLASEVEYLTCYWPLQKSAIGIARASLEQTLGRREGELISWLMRRMSIEDPSLVIPIYWVLDASWVIGLTAEVESVGVVGIVDLSDSVGSNALEVVVHEALHVLDAAHSSEATLFGSLRDELRRTVGHRLDVERVVHCVIAAEAQSAVSWILDSSYSAFARGGVFEGELGAAPAWRVDTVAAIDAWRSHVSGAVSRAEALATMVCIMSFGHDK